MTWKYRYKKQIMIGSGIFGLVFLLILYISFTSATSMSGDDNFDHLLRDDDYALVVEYENDYIYIDIKGEVLNPGLFRLTTNDRVSDAIERAGGLTYNADVSVINLSLRLRDEMVIIIHSKEQVRNFKDTTELERRAIEQCRVLLSDELRNDACIGSGNYYSSNSGGLVNINTAPVEQLVTLSGIGEARALAIIAFREENGMFSSVYDIKNVSGIGASIFANIQAHITI